MKNKSILILFVVMLLIPLTLIYYNIRNNIKFFDVSFMSLLTYYISIFVSYYLVQLNSNKRYQKEIFVKLLQDFQSCVVSPSSYSIKRKEDITNLTSTKRTISNYIGYIKKCEHLYHIEDEVAFISKKLEEYQTFFGDHISDVNYLASSEKELKRPLELINEKLYEIMLKLYE